MKNSGITALWRTKSISLLFLIYFHRSGVGQQEQRRQQSTTENRRCQSRDRPSWLSSNEQPTPLTIGGLFASDLATMHNQPGLYNLYRDGFGNAASDPKENFSISRLVRRTIDMALVDIRRHPCILNGFKLKIQNEDTQCKPTKGMKILFDIMSGKVPKLALFGAVCSNVNEPLAMTAKYFKMVQLSYTETHPKFTVDKDSYSFFYSVVPAFRNINMAQIHLLKSFDWRRVGIIVQRDDARYALPQEEVQSALETKYSIKVEASVGFSHRKSNIHDELTTLKKLDVRIFIGFFNETAASEIFCQAFKLGLTKEVHVWFLASFSTEEWWKENRSNCTDRQLADALRGHFMFSFAPLRTDRGKTISHNDVRYFRKRYLRHVCPRSAATSPRCAAFKFGGYVYDGVWTLAVALEKLVVDMAKQRSQKFEALADSWDNGPMQREWGVRLLDALNVTNFEGVTGTVRFDNNQRQGLIKIAQFQKEKYVKVGEFDAANENFYLNYNKTVWNGSVAPTDRIDFLIETRHVDFIVFFVTCAVTVTGIVAAFWFLFMNIYFRNHRFIKMSSPNMNNLIVAGCILTYLSVILLGLDTRMISNSMFEFMCTAKIWTLSFGFTLAFGSMFSKTWRVHSIFTNIKLNKKAITDYQLFVVIGILLMVDFFILTIWLFVDDFTRIDRSLPAETYMERNLKIEPHIEACYSPHAVIFQGLLMIFKGLQLISGCFLAWETRHVNVPALNDSKYIGASVYNVVVMCTLGVPISFVLRDHVNASYILISVFIVFCTTLTLGLVFIPKIIELIRNPKTDMNDRRFRRTMLASRHPSLRREISLNSIEDYRERLNHVERENSLWKKTAQEKVCEFYRLKARLDVIIGSAKEQESKNHLTVANATEKQRLIRGTGLMVIENIESISTIDYGNMENAKAGSNALNPVSPGTETTFLLRPVHSSSANGSIYSDTTELSPKKSFQNRSPLLNYDDEVYADYHSLKSSIAEGDEECSADEQWTITNANKIKPNRDNFSSRSSSFRSPLVIENRSTKKRSHSLKAQQHLIRVIADAHNDQVTLLSSAESSELNVVRANNEKTAKSRVPSCLSAHTRIDRSSSLITDDGDYISALCRTPSCGDHSMVIKNDQIKSNRSSTCTMFSMDDIKTTGIIIYDDNQDQQKMVPYIVLNDELQRPTGSTSGDQEKIEQIQEISHHMDHPLVSSRGVSGSTYAVDAVGGLLEHQKSTPATGLTLPRGMKWIGKCTDNVLSNVAKKKINRILVSDEETPDQLKKYASRPVPNNLIEYRGPECPFITKTTDFKLYSTFITKYSNSSLVDDAQSNNA